MAGSATDFLAQRVGIRWRIWNSSCSYIFCLLLLICFLFYWFLLIWLSFFLFVLVIMMVFNFSENFAYNLFSCDFVRFYYDYFLSFRLLWWFWWWWFLWKWSLWLFLWLSLFFLFLFGFWPCDFVFAFFWNEAFSPPVRQGLLDFMPGTATMFGRQTHKWEECCLARGGCIVWNIARHSKERYHPPDPNPPNSSARHVW